ncbi:MAG: TIGR03915 family putative DNA repair protein [Deltaproteobacteria bacterium]|nr:TIGR03915 family putative DNA repair protein [Deltaproteobacteria bacterium]
MRSLSANSLPARNSCCCLAALPLIALPGKLADCEDRVRAFVYDKTFDGLLSAIFDAYTRKVFPDALLGREDALPLMVTDSHAVCTEPGKAARVFAGLKKKLSPDGLRCLLYVWLSEEAGSDLLLLRYMRAVFDARRLIEKNFSDRHVLAVSRLAEQVSCERHRLMGFVRFRQSATGMYCAFIAPRYNVLPLVSGHFAERLSDQDWILYDTARRYGIAFDRGAFRDVVPGAAGVDDAALQANRVQGDRRGRIDPLVLADNELLFQALWKAYFTSTAIRERTNPRLQARCMPRRFWTYLTEKQS